MNTEPRHNEPASEPATTDAKGPGSGDDLNDHRGMLLTFGFGTTILMWAIAYAGLAPGAGVGVWVVVGAISLLPVVGGYLVTRRMGGIASALKLALLLTGINLIIIASLNDQETTAEAIRASASWIAGFAVASVLLCVLGAAIARFRANESLGPIAWPSRFAFVVALTTLPLLISGGVVTGLEAGMAVPDWLTTFDYPMMFYPMVKMQERYDVYAEHFHRLWGLLVGLNVLTLAIQVHLIDGRRWVKRLVVGVLLIVIIQGVLGGTRVTENNLPLAIVHGVFGQITFATIVALAAFASTTWRTRTATIHEQADTAWRLSLAVPILLTIQLILGALYRHLNAEIGTNEMGAHGLLLVHIIMACVVTVAIIFAAGRAWASHTNVPAIRQTGVALIGLVVLQLLLGGAAMLVVLMRRGEGDIPAFEVAVTTAHQTSGALLLATSVLLAVWTRRLLVLPDAKGAASGATDSAA